MPREKSTPESTRGKGRGQLGEITSQRMAEDRNLDNYRAQLNTNKKFWAYAYGAIYYHNHAKAQDIKNFKDNIAALEADIAAFFRAMLTEGDKHFDPAFADSVQEFINDSTAVNNSQGRETVLWPEPSLRADAVEFLKGLAPGKLEALHTPDK